METVFAITVPTGALMTARTFFDKYGPEERYDIMKHLPGISAPLLVLFAVWQSGSPSLRLAPITQAAASSTAAIISIPDGPTSSGRRSMAG